MNFEIGLLIDFLYASFSHRLHYTYIIHNDQTHNEQEIYDVARIYEHGTFQPWFPFPRGENCREIFLESIEDLETGLERDRTVPDRRS